MTDGTYMSLPSALALVPCGRKERRGGATARPLSPMTKEADDFSPRPQKAPETIALHACLGYSAYPQYPQYPPPFPSALASQGQMDGLPGAPVPLMGGGGGGFLCPFILFSYFLRIASWRAFNRRRLFGRSKDPSLGRLTSQGSGHLQRDRGRSTPASQSFSDVRRNPTRGDQKQTPKQKTPWIRNFPQWVDGFSRRLMPSLAPKGVGKISTYVASLFLLLSKLCRQLFHQRCFLFWNMSSSFKPCCLLLWSLAWLIFLDGFGNALSRWVSCMLKFGGSFTDKSLVTLGNGT